MISMTVFSSKRIGRFVAVDELNMDEDDGQIQCMNYELTLVSPARSALSLTV